MSLAAGLDDIIAPNQEAAAIVALRSFLALLRLSRPADTEPLGMMNTSSGAFSVFSGRKMDIVNALSGGEINKMIARKLGVTPETVEWHMKSLMRKLRATSREEIVNNAIVLGITFAREGR